MDIHAHVHRYTCVNVSSFKLVLETSMVASVHKHILYTDDNDKHYCYRVSISTYIYIHDKMCTCPSVHIFSGQNSEIHHVVGSLAQQVCKEVQPFCMKLHSSESSKVCHLWIEHIHVGHQHSVFLHRTKQLRVHQYFFCSRGRESSNKELRDCRLETNCVLLWRFNRQYVVVMSSYRMQNLLHM